MNRLTSTLSKLKENKKKALVAFITAGFPDIDTTRETIKILSNNGADIIEIGVPFSDPIADGPTIQASSDFALKGGVNLNIIFDMIKDVRKETEAPILLMSYSNPLLRQGFNNTARKAHLNGADGFIIPDVIPEESREIKSICAHNELSLIFLAAPNSTDERLRFIDSESEAFVYVVSLTGVTGKRASLPGQSIEFLRRAGSIITHPRFLGFGISNAEQVRRLKPYTDGIIVGSAFIEILRDNKDKKTRENKIAAFTRSLRESLDRRF